MKPCPKPVRKPKRKAKRTNARRALELAVEKNIRELVYWREAGKCVEAEIDGTRCGGSLQWGHVIPRSRSSWLKLWLGNSALQCANHNLLHHLGDPTMFLAIGEKRVAALRDEMAAHRNERPSVEDLKARLYLYQKLLDWRPAEYTHEDLVNGGYYG